MTQKQPGWTGPFGYSGNNGRYDAGFANSYGGVNNDYNYYDYSDTNIQHEILNNRQKASQLLASGVSSAGSTGSASSGLVGSRDDYHYDTYDSYGCYEGKITKSTHQLYLDI